MRRQYDNYKMVVLLLLVFIAGVVVGVIGTRAAVRYVISSVVPNPDLVWRRIERALAADAFTPLPRGSIHLTLGYCPSARKARKVKRPEGRAPVPIRVGSLNTSEPEGCPLEGLANDRAGWPSMRLAEEVEQIRKRRRGDEAHGDGPAQKLLVAPPIGPSHARQKVVSMLFFALPRPKHKRPLVRLGCNSQTGRLWQTNIPGAGQNRQVEQASPSALRRFSLAG